MVEREGGNSVDFLVLRLLLTSILFEQSTRFLELSFIRHLFFEFMDYYSPFSNQEFMFLEEDF